MRIFLTLLVLALLPTQALAYSGLDAAAQQVGITNQSVATISSTAYSIVQVNPNRAYLLIENTGSNPLQVKFGSNFTGSEGLSVAAGVIYQPNPVPINQIWVKSSLGTTISVIEGIR